MSTRAVRREYARLAGSYNARWGGYVRATTARTIERLALVAGERLIDVGCGTGALLCSVLRSHPSTLAVGLDLSSAMLAIARRDLPAEVRLVAGDAMAIPFASRTFDVAVSANSYHYWPDPVRGLREIARVLRPGGRLIVTDWCDDYLACRLCDRFLRISNRAHRRIFGAETCGAHLEAAGLVVTGIDRYKVSWLWGMMTATGRAPAA